MGLLETRKGELFLLEDHHHHPYQLSPPSSLVLFLFCSRSTMISSLPRVALALTFLAPALAQKAGSFADGGDSQVSAMMVRRALYLSGALVLTAPIDVPRQRQDGLHHGQSRRKRRPDQWASRVGRYLVSRQQRAFNDLLIHTRNIDTHEVTLQDIRTNVFCASGMHLPNGSFATFGGNAAVGPGGSLGSEVNPGGFSAAFDETYQDFDGTRAIRILKPCPPGSDFASEECGWFDNPETLSMQVNRWYSTAEPTATGQIVLIGGYTQGGYVNRNYPNIDPEFEGGAATATYEYYPNFDNVEAATMQFMIHTSGLNSYAHTFLMPSGNMFVQANLSTGMSCLCVSIIITDFHS